MLHSDTPVVLHCPALDTQGCRGGLSYSSPLTPTPLLGTLPRRPFVPLAFQFILSHAGWQYAQVRFGETFSALVSGLQGALWEPGVVPVVARTDNLTAATYELRDRGGRVFIESYGSMLGHYGLNATRTNPRAVRTRTELRSGDIAV